MESPNQVILLGQLCHSPNALRAKSGQFKLAFQIAVPRALPNDSPCLAPQAHDPRLDYITIVLLGQTARKVHAQRLGRGTWVKIRGRLQTWSAHKWEVLAQEVQLAMVELV